MEDSSQLNAKQTKHQWMPQEDAKLVECLVELVATSWKCDNGTVKSGYAKQLEKMINEKLAGCGLKANPHIESRVKMLKKHYFAIVEMMGASDFGWNDTDKMIVVEKQIYKEWTKSHPNVTGLYNKSFPHFEELGSVFGKDRAQGTNVEDPAEAVAAMESELETQMNSLQGDQNLDPSLAEAETEFQDDSEMPETLGGMSSSSTQHKNKRKRDNKGLSYETAEVIADSIKDIKSAFELHSSHILDLITCFKVKKEGVDKRMKLMAMLRDVDGLSIDERMKATIIISRGNSLTDVFFSFMLEDMLGFVKTVLNNYS